jgi:hypothetical protein
MVVMRRRREDGEFDGGDEKEEGGGDYEGGDQKEEGGW